jgi:hypothetical protein
MLFWVKVSFVGRTSVIAIEVSIAISIGVAIGIGLPTHAPRCVDEKEHIRLNRCLNGHGKLAVVVHLRKGEKRKHRDGD